MTCAHEGLLNAESTQRAMLAANYMGVEFVFSFLSTEWFIFAFIQCHLLRTTVQLMCVFLTQRIHATVLSSPRSLVTVFSHWALMISRCLLIAKQKETHLHIIGKCLACPLTVYWVRLQCVASVNVVQGPLLSCYGNRRYYCIGYICISVHSLHVWW